MKPWFRLVLFTITFIECVTCIYFGLTLYNRFLARRNVLGATQVVRLKKSDFNFPTDDKFKHFYEPKPNTVIEETPKWLPYVTHSTINEDSLNDRYNYSVEKPQHTFRIITVGDSFTYGLYVDTKDNYSERLEDMLNAKRCSGVDKFEVLNLGVPGYDIGYSLERFMQRGRKYSPDLVVWLMNSFNFELYADYKLAREDEIVRTTSPDELVKLENEYEARGEYSYPSVKAAADTIAHFGKDTIRTVELSYLQDFKNYYQGPLFLGLLDLPFWPSNTLALIDTYASSRSSTWVDRDLPPIHGTQYGLADGHPNSEGHKKIAEIIYTYLRGNHIIPCSDVQ